MNADSKGLQARQMIARGEAPGSRGITIPSPERARQVWPPYALGEAFQAAIQSTQAAGWLPGDEAALGYIVTLIAPKLGSSAEVIAKRLRT